MENRAAMQPASQPLRILDGMQLPDAEAIASIVHAITSRPAVADAAPFTAGFSDQGKLLATAQVRSAVDLVQLMRMMEMLPHWEPLVLGEPEDLLNCDLLFALQRA